jgi:two-component system LytT family response regulator
MKIKSLIIDDDPFIKSLLVDMIMIHFPNVETLDTAKNGKGGIEEIEIDQPDLIFLDVEMTDMAGFEMLSYYENPPF